MLYSFLAAAQFPNLPYNPDENGDGLIGVVDLQGLLANYGNEFESAVLSEDGESAIVYTGEMAYYVCEHSCEQLPGFWQVVNPSDLVPVYSELNVVSNTSSWVNRKGFEGNLGLNSCPYYRGDNSSSNRDILSSEPYLSLRCYCAAKQLPRVEYDVCYGYDTGSGNNGIYQAFTELSDCVNAKLEQGWQLYGSQSWGPQYNKVSQTLWRWAE